MLNNIVYKCFIILQLDSFTEGIPLPFNLDQMDATFILIMLCFLIFARIYRGDFALLKSNITLLRSFKKNIKSTKVFTSRDMWYTYFLVMQFALLASICIYNIFTDYGLNITDIRNPLRTMGLFIILIFVFFIIKIFIYRLIGYMFDKKKEMAIFEYLYIIMIETLGIAFFIPTLLLVYASYLYTPIAILLAVLALAALVRLLYRIALYFIREKFNYLFMIAYLCSVEIIPYIFLATGLVYLYKTDELIVLW